MRRWNGRDIVAIILAIGVSGTIVLLIVVEFVPHHGHVSDEEAAALSTALGAAIGALATYLGGSIGNGHDRNKDDDTKVTMETQPPEDQEPNEVTEEEAEEGDITQGMGPAPDEDTDTTTDTDNEEQQ
jgi:hypothetical protein